MATGIFEGSAGFVAIYDGADPIIKVYDGADLVADFTAAAISLNSSVDFSGGASTTHDIILNLAAGTNRVLILGGCNNTASVSTNAATFDQGGSDQAAMTALTPQVEGNTVSRIFIYAIPDGVGAGNKTLRVTLSGSGLLGAYGYCVNGAMVTGYVESGSHAANGTGGTSTLASVPAGSVIFSGFAASNTAITLAPAGDFAGGDELAEHIVPGSGDFLNAYAAQLGWAGGNFAATWSATGSSLRVVTAAVAIPPA